MQPLKIKHETDYVAKRAAAYPSVEEQMDMLWHAMNKGEAEKIEPFFSKIKEVKDTYRKT